MIEYHVDIVLAKVMELLENQVLWQILRVNKIILALFSFAQGILPFPLLIEVPKDRLSG